MKRVIISCILVPIFFIGLVSCGVDRGDEVTEKKVTVMEETQTVETADTVTTADKNNGPVYIDTQDEETETTATSNGVYAEYSKKVDGDTAWFIIDGEEIKVRFLGIDTPETVKENTEVQAWGPEASEYTTDRLENANEIYLEYDPNSDTEDAYGRTLAWVWVDGSLLEEELVSLGYAKVAYIYGDYLYTDELYNAQEQAQENGVGLWS